MNFEWNEDQRAFLDAVGKVVARHAATPLLPQRLQHAPALEHDLREAGFFDAFVIDELGPVAAAALVMQAAKLPLCAELAASALVAPWLCPEAKGPFALDWDGAAPVRFLPVARSLLRVRGSEVEIAVLQARDVRAVDSLFAYPMGVPAQPASLRFHRLAGADAARLRDLWRVGIAAEMAGLLEAALESVLQHVKDRRQFGRPLGAFQAVQHRLAECATRIEGLKWLALHAAATGSPVDAALAAGQAQETSRKVAYDLHQFMGAMGLTLEHPLHRWTYRAKLLQSDLGGSGRQFAAAARTAWGTRAAHPHRAQEQGTTS